jgi:hypothetical protein
MPAISEEIIRQVEGYKDVIGWSWPTIGERVGLGVIQVANFRKMKLAMTDAQVSYLKAVAEAVAAVPLPEKGTMPAPALIWEGNTYSDTQERYRYQNPTDERYTHASLQPEAFPQIQTGPQVRVMLLDDIAAKLADEYHDIAKTADINADELAGARFAIGKMAERFGVEDQVKALIKERKPAPPVVAEVTERWMPPLNQPTRAPFENDATF